MRMRRLILAAIPAAMIVALAGCGNGANGTRPPADEPKDAPGPGGEPAADPTADGSEDTGETTDGGE